MHVRRQDGFSLAELLIAMAIMLLISGAATSALMKMTGAQATIWNRTQMHSGIRGATEVLQQEVGQADRKSTRLNSSHRCISYAVFCLKKKNRRSLARGSRRVA